MGKHQDLNPPDTPFRRKPSRRSFLRQTGLGVAALAVLDRLDGARRLFADELTAAANVGANLGAPGTASSYSLSPGVKYLNHASIGTVPRMVQDAHRRYIETCEGNPWLHVWSDAWVEPMDTVRHHAAELLGCAVDEVILPHNTTEVFNVLAQGLPLGPGDEVLMSTLNHSGASECWFHQAKARGFTVRRFDFPVADAPTLDAGALVDLHEAQITPKTRVLVVPHVDNSVGLRHPLAALASMAKAKGVRWIAVDGAQTAGMVDLDLTGVDVYATSGHKWIQGPKETGLGFIHSDLHDVLRPMWVTWGQKSWHGTARAFEDYGTRDFPSLLALGDAITFQRSIPAEVREARHRQLWQATRDAVERRPRVRWCSPNAWEDGAALYAIGVETPSRQLFEQLFREHGYVVRPFETEHLNTLRLSPNLFNTIEEIEGLLDLC